MADTANKRNPAQIDYMRVEIARRYLRGESQSTIAETLGMTQQMVSYDLQRIREQWRQSALVDFNEVQARELARIDLLEREYWTAWDHSQTEKLRTQTERKTIGIAEDKNKIPVEEKAVVQKEQRDGNPAFLDGIRWCIEQRCKIFGLYEPEKYAIVDWRKEADEKGINVTSEYRRLVERFVTAIQASSGEDDSGRMAGSETQGTNE